MGRRRQDKKQDKHHAAEGGGGQQEAHKPDPLVRVLALHPSSDVVALAVGPKVRIAQYGEGQKVMTPEDSAFPGHGACALRALEYSVDGSRLITGGDDKLLKLWDTSSWQCLGQWKAPKRVCAGTFTRDAKWAFFADKYGDVLVASCDGSSTPELHTAPPVLLGHLCSILTSVTVSPDNKYIVTTDKDKKVRVSIMPPNPSLGSVEIQTYCLGHTGFVTTSAFVSRTNQESSGKATLLVTGSGDGTVRLWDHEMGKLLDIYVASEPEVAADVAAELAAEVAVTSEPEVTAEVAVTSEPEVAADVAAKSDAAATGALAADREGGVAEGDVAEGDAAAGAVAADDGEEEDGDGDEDDGEEKGPKCAAVLSVAASPCGCYIAVVVEGKDSIDLLSVDWDKQRLSLHQQLSLPSLRCPCHALFDRKGKLWLAGGPPLQSSTSAHVAVAAAGSSCEFVECTAECMSPELLAALEQRCPEEEDKLAAGLLTAQLTLHLEIQNKRPFTFAQLQERKRQRNDHKESLRLHGSE